MAGDTLKRAPRGIDPDHPLIDDLRRKDFICSTEFSEDAALRPDFVDRYGDACRAAAPYVRFITEAVGQRFD
jgi:uncharacterized protein (DUF2461 family)